MKINASITITGMKVKVPNGPDLEIENISMACDQDCTAEELEAWTKTICRAFINTAQVLNETL